MELQLQHNFDTLQKYFVSGLHTFVYLRNISEIKCMSQESVLSFHHSLIPSAGKRQAPAVNSLRIPVTTNH